MKLNLKQIDESIKQLFSNVSVIDGEGKEFVVPCTWATKEKILNREKIQLPLLHFYRGSITFPEGFPVIFYHVGFFSLYHDETDQIIEQIISKFALNQTKWKLLSIDNNKNMESSATQKVIYYVFTLSHEITS